MGDAHVNERDQEYNLDIAENISHRPGSKHRLSTPCRLGCSKWCSKYFWEGKSTLWSLPGRGVSVRGGGGVFVMETPSSITVEERVYASYWNAFFLFFLLHFIHN